MRRTALSLCCCATIGLAGGAAAEQAPLRLSHDQFKVSSVNADWCANAVDLRVDADDPSVFARPESQVMQGDLVGGVRAVMPFSCPQATRMNLAGWSRGTLVFAGTASADNNWKLVGFYVAP